MSRRRTQLQTVELALAALTVLVGWGAVVGQLRTAGSPADGTAWLVAFAAVATLGLAGLAGAQRHGWHVQAALALVLVALSPTVFAYPLNLLIVGLVIVELVASSARRARRP
jgi:hypothetical protein